jgi:hypothetical protein
MTRRTLIAAVMVAVGCGRSVLPDEALAEADRMKVSSVEEPATCGSKVPSVLPEDRCRSTASSLADVQRAIVGRWRGTVVSTSTPKELKPATVSFGGGSTLTVEGESLSRPLWPAGARVELKDWTTTCDAAGLMFAPGESQEAGSFWWVRLCGPNRLVFTYSTIGAGRRVVNTFDLTR